MAENIFQKTWAWAKENPVKASLIAVTTVSILVIAFSKPVQRKLGLRKAATSKKALPGKKTLQLAGHKKPITKIKFK
jgi:hypothetical protein